MIRTRKPSGEVLEMLHQLPVMQESTPGGHRSIALYVQKGTYKPIYLHLHITVDNKAVAALWFKICEVVEDDLSDTQRHDALALDFAANNVREAAPDLLQACTLLLGASSPFGSTSLNVAKDVAREAIAKAEPLK